MGKSIMFQGTGSSVGKSLITAAFCRIFMQDGVSSVPFKSQNMALNSYITDEGMEMGRAQVVQAEAAGLKPSVLMNPVLLKPTTDRCSQVIVNGKSIGNMSAVEYHEYKPQLLNTVVESFDKLKAQYDAVVIEGAGSPAEINLRDRDIVNMGFAEEVDAPVILIGDIDRGGVFASIVGTIALLSESEKERVKGVIINKFRGDLEILKPGIKMLEEIIKKPVLGVIPYVELNIEDEDSVTERFAQTGGGAGQINIEIVKLPHIAIFTDFVPLECYDDVKVTYIKSPRESKNPDIIIIPGTKNTLDDMQFLNRNGFDVWLKKQNEINKLIIGVCGGYQILGKTLNDPHKTESDIGSIEGLCLLNVDTTFEVDKVTTQETGTITKINSTYFSGLDGVKIDGYEIHMGRTTGEVNNDFFGAVNEKGNIFATYLHGIFNNTEFVDGMLNNIRELKGLNRKKSDISFDEYKQNQYNLLADTVRNNTNIEAVYDILRGE